MAQFVVKFAVDLASRHESGLRQPVQAFGQHARLRGTCAAHQPQQHELCARGLGKDVARACGAAYFQSEHFDSDLARNTLSAGIFSTIFM